MSTPLGRLYQREKRDLGLAESDDDPATLAPTGGLASSKTTIGGEQVDYEDPQTGITFTDESGHLSGEHGRPRPRNFWHAKQVGQTPPMQLLKNVVARQLTGGKPKAEADDELRGPVADFADLVIDIYDGPHFQEKSLDNLLVDAVGDMLDAGWAYWEILPSSGGSYPVAGFKPLPPLQVQHNIDEDTGDFADDPAVYVVPHKRNGGQVTIAERDPTELDRDQIVMMRWPLATASDLLYGESLATKVREWLELIIDVDVHQKRHYSDSQLPSGFLHFQGSIGDDKLQSIQQDIIEAAGDPHELVTTTSEDGANWIPVGDSVVDLDAIAEQQWYFKLVLAAVGLNSNELGIVEGAGFAKETPALQKAVYKNVTKPALNGIFQPQNTQVVPKIAESVGIDDVPFRLGLERFDPVQEQIEREETISEWGTGAPSLNELRGGLGREAVEYEIEIGGEVIDLADTPKYVVDKLVSMETPGLTVGDSDDGTASAEQGALGEDPVVSLAEAGDKLGIADARRTARRLDANTKDLDDTIEVESSFLVSVAYERQANILQLEFERTGPNWTYWYGGVPEFRFFNFLQATSKGKYFNRYIRGEYQYARLS